MAIDLNLIDKLLADYKKPEDIIGEHGLLKQLTKALLERAMQAEMTDHVGYAKQDEAGNNSGNSRNGKTTKELKGEFGKLRVETARDRNGWFEPKIGGKGQTRFTGFDDKVISMYARGMSTREIAGHLQEIYGVELSPTLISNVTEEVMEEVKTWQGRPLDAVYPIVYLDALMVKVRDAGHIRNRAMYVAIRVHRIQRPALPRLDLLHHLFGDGGNQRRTQLYSINLLQVSGDLARAHAPRIHRYDLVVEAREARLSFADDLRLERTVAVPRRLQRQLPEVAFQRLSGLAIARVAAVVAGLVVLRVAHMIGHLGLHGSLQERFGELLQQSMLADNIFRLLIVRQQFVNQVEVDGHRVSLEC